LVDHVSYTPTRNLYLPNGVDVFGFYGWLVAESVSANTDTTIMLASNLTAGGYFPNVSGSGTMTYQQTSSIAGRPRALKLITGAAADLSSAQGASPGFATSTPLRVLYPNTNMPNAYSRIEGEAVMSVALSLTGSDWFFGICSTANDPWGSSGVYSMGVGYQSGDPNWSAVGVNNGAPNKTSTGVAVALGAVYRLKWSYDGTTFAVTVNGTTVNAGGLPPTSQAMGPLVNQHGRAATTVHSYVEWLVDRMV
jgi:hypothetical protein